jgi:hypothetical protein
MVSVLISDQELDAFIGDHSVPAERKKPWGTSHAILSVKDAVKNPFAVINADDFYGRDGFKKAYDFLTTQCKEDVYALVGYHLANTLSESTARMVIWSSRKATDPNTICLKTLRRP